MIDTLKLMKYAINYLSKFSSSKSNLKKILNNKIRRLKIEKKDKFLLYQSVNEIIEKLEKNKLINDSDYTSLKIKSFAIQGKSRWFIKSYFLQKGIEKNIVAKNFEEYDSQNPEWEIQSAKIFFRKKRLSKIHKDKEKNFSKMARAGFNYEISKKILEEI